MGFLLEHPSGLETNLFRKIKIKSLGYRGTIVDLSCIIVAFINSLMEITSFRSFMIAVTTFLKDLTGSTYSGFIRKFTKYVNHLLDLCFAEGFSFANASVAQGSEQVRSFVDQVKTVLADHDNLSKSAFGAKLSSFCSMLICTPFFKRLNLDPNWIGFTHLHKKALEKTYQNTHSYSILYSVIDTSVFIIDKVLLVMDTGNFKSIYVDNSDLLKYEEEYRFLSYYCDKLEVLSNQEVTLDEYWRRCDALIEENKRLLKFYSSDKKMCVIYKGQQSVLARCKFRSSDKLKVAAHRDPPLAFCLHGTPGIGKSDLVDKILTIMYQNEQFLGRGNKPYSLDLKYTYCHDDEYMSEFRASHEVCLIDDVDQFRDSIIEQDSGGAIRHTIDFINPVPYVTNQAELENKGMIPFRCKYVVMTTNSYAAGMDFVFKKTSGAKRRFLFIDVSVLPAYRKAGQTQLAGDPSNPNNHELHEFYPRKYQSVGTSYNEVFWDQEECAWVSGKPKKGLTMLELSVFLRGLQLVHYEQLDLAKESTKNFIEAKICANCTYSEALCSCDKAQSSFVSEVSLAAEGEGWFFFLYPFIAMLSYCNDFITYFWIQMSIVLIGVLPSRYFVPWYIAWMPDFVIRRAVSEEWIFWVSQNPRLKTFHMLQKASALKAARLRENYHIAGFFMALIALRGLYKMYNFGTSKSQGAIVSNVENVAAQSNPWGYNPTRVTKMKGACATTTYEQLQQRVLLNLCYIRFRFMRDGRMKETHCRGLGIHGDILVIPGHAWEEIGCNEVTIDVIRSLDSERGPNRFGLPLGKGSIRAHETEDLVYVKHPGFGTFRDLRKFLLDDFIEGKIDGCAMFRDESGCIRTVDVDALSKTKLYYRSTLKGYDGVGYVGYSKQETLDGDCGGIYIGRTLNGACILGIHIAYRYRSTGNKLSAVRLDKEVPNFHELVPHSFEDVKLDEYYSSAQSMALKSKIYSKCPTQCVKGPFIVYGALDIHRRKLKSNVYHTLYSEEVLRHYCLLDHTHFSPREVSSRDAAVNNLNNLVKKANIPVDILSSVKNALLLSFYDVIVDKGIVLPSGPYGIDVGVNGLDGVTYVDRLVISTSGGFGHKGPKINCLNEASPTDDHSVRYTLSGDVLAELENTKTLYLQGKRSNIVWDATFKDEPISAKKVRAQKIRVFSSGPLHFNVLLRQYYLWCIPLFSGKYRHLFGMAIGANAVGKDWTVLAKYISKHGASKIIAGDYKSFDKMMPPEVMMSAFWILIEIAKIAGFSSADVKIMTGIATDICYPLTNYFGTVVEFFGSNPSGHPLTTPINGICNQLLIMCASAHLIPDVLTCRSFPEEYLSIVTYGDDNIMSSKDDRLTHTSLAETLEKWGVTFTMADKSGISVPFINLSQADFLKRSFAWDSQHYCYAAPLDQNSIIKSLSICTKSNSITFKEQCAQIIDSACREYFQYGFDAFRNERHFFSGLVDKYDLRGYLPLGRLPMWGELEEARFDTAQGSGVVDRDQRSGSYWKVERPLLMKAKFAEHTDTNTFHGIVLKINMLIDSRGCQYMYDWEDLVKHWKYFNDLVVTELAVVSDKRAMQFDTAQSAKIVTVLIENVQCAEEYFARMFFAPYTLSQVEFALKYRWGFHFYSDTTRDFVDHFWAHRVCMMRIADRRLEIDLTDEFMELGQPLDWHP